MYSIFISLSKFLSPKRKRIVNQYYSSTIKLLILKCFSLEDANVPTRLQTAIKIETIAEPYIKRKAICYLEKGRVVILDQV